MLEVAEAPDLMPLILTLAFATDSSCEVARFCSRCLCFYAKYQLDNVYKSKIKPFPGDSLSPRKVHICGQGVMFILGRWIWGDFVVYRSPAYISEQEATD
jgi:hypothetical protein